MGQVTAVGQVKTHQPLVGPHDGLVDLEVGGAAGQGLDVDTPLSGVEAKGLESALLASELNLVNVLVAAVVAGAGVAFRVLILHRRSECLHDASGREVLGWNQHDRF